MSEVNSAALAFQALNADDIANILAGAKDERKAREESKGGGSGGYIPFGYPQPGVSKIRVFLDPERKLYRPVKTFKLPSKKKVMDPRFFNGKDPAGTEVPKELTEQIWSLQKGLNFNNAGGLTPGYQVLCYIHLIEAENKDEKFWKPGTTYVGVMNGKFEEALLAQISSLSKGAGAEMAKSLNPLSEGWAFDMTLVKGSQGSVSLTPTVGISYPGITITAAYKPLREQFVEENLNMTDMTALVDALKEKRVELELDEPDPDAGNDAPTPPPGNENTGNQQAAPQSQSTPQAQPQSQPTPTGTTENTGGGVAGDSWAENAGTGTSTTAPVVDQQQNNAAEETYGLTPDQINAAKAAGIGLKQFAEMIGVNQQA